LLGGYCSFGYAVDGFGFSAVDNRYDQTVQILKQFKFLFNIKF